MRKLETHAIDGVTYEFRQMGASEGVAFLQMLAPAFGKLDVKGGGGAAFIASLASVDVNAALAKLAETTTVIGAGGKRAPLPLIYEEHFAGEYGALMEWASKAFEVSFGDFFGRLAGKIGSSRPNSNGPAEETKKEAE